MPSYHFSLGNSSTGPVGFCARIVAESPEAALQELKQHLPAEHELDLEDEDGDPIGKAPGSPYIEVYFNIDAITVADIDEVDDEDDD